MNQIVEQTHEEKFAMYSKLSKEQLINMLIESNSVINRLCAPRAIYPTEIQKPFVDPNYRYDYYTTCDTTGASTAMPTTRNQPIKQ